MVRSVHRISLTSVFTRMFPGRRTLADDEYVYLLHNVLFRATDVLLQLQCVTAAIQLRGHLLDVYDYLQNV